jgi:hypothetical protein
MRKDEHVRAGELICANGTILTLDVEPDNEEALNGLKTPIKTTRKERMSTDLLSSYVYASLPLRSVFSVERGHQALVWVAAESLALR